MIPDELWERRPDLAHRALTPEERADPDVNRAHPLHITMRRPPGQLVVYRSASLLQRLVEQRRNPQSNEGEPR